MNAGPAVARALRIWLLLALASVAALAGALATGSSPIRVADLPRLLWAGDASPAAEVLRQLRLPRALAAFGTGGLLALAGALMQVLLRNPLADPYVLGISGGAAVGALGAMLLGLGAVAVQGGAFGGALLAIVLVFALARGALARPGPGGTQDEAAPRLLLT
ncbi:MAG: iron chelate uptake ABC transporter family permease subunit, partial [Burkholderiales bacterium]|nr:iron chelate uptake ABC transporter family permease subunit [Burkholderiales bacterium]